jgi:putative endopeptidase
MVQTSESQDKAFDINNFDKTVEPSADFFKFANGGWMDSNPIPPEYPSWNTFTALHVKNQERLKDIVDGLQAGTFGNLTDEQAKLAAYYTAAMNEDAVEAAGTAPL